MPIRWRLTLMFAAVMAVLLAALIAFLYYHFRSDLDYNIYQSLRARAQDVAGLVRQEEAADTRGALRQLPASPDNVVQVLDQSGQVIGAVSAGATSIDARNTSDNVDITTGDADASNVSGSFVGQALNDATTTVGTTDRGCLISQLPKCCVSVPRN